MGASAGADRTVAAVRHDDADRRPGLLRGDLSAAACAGAVERVAAARWAGAALVAVAALAGAWLAARLGPGRPFDLTEYFEPAGRALWAGRWSQVYGDAGTQAGPVQLAVLAGLVGAARAVGLAGGVAVGASSLAGFAAACWACTRRVVIGPYAHAAALAATTIAVAGSASLVVTYAHPAQFAVPALWAAAAAAARRGRGLAAGVAVAAAGGWETWGLLGVACGAAGGWRQLWRAGLVAAAGTALLYGPFAATGSFAMFDKRWLVAGWGLPRLFWPDATVAGWGMRFAQAGVTVAAGTAAAWRLRHGAAAALAPLAVTVARLWTDPLQLDYYWVCLMFCAALAAAWGACRPGRAGRWALGAGVACLLPAPAAAVSLPLVAACTAAAVGFAGPDAPGV